MSGEIVGHKDIDDDISKLLTDEERRTLQVDLHRIFVWVGEKVPDRFVLDRKLLIEEMDRLGLQAKDLPPEVHMDEGSIDLHELIWKLLNAPQITDVERDEMHELIRILEIAEKEDEKHIQHDKLTHHQARLIYKEAAGFIRAMLDLKDILKGKVKSQKNADAITSKVNDARRWKAFMDEVKSSKVVEDR